MKRHYLYLISLVYGVMGYTSGIDDSHKEASSSIASSRTELMSSGVSQEADNPTNHNSTPALPPIPLYKSSSPREILSPKEPSPKGRILKQRFVHPSGDYSATSPKQNHAKQNTNASTTPTSEDQKPPST